MFIHAEDGKLIRKKDIIGIFDLETTSISKKTKEFLRKNEKQGNFISLSFEIPKTFIVCGNKEVYISQLSSKTLYKRAERIEEFGTEN